MPLAPLSSEPGFFLPPLPLPPPSHCVSWAPPPPSWDRPPAAGGRPWPGVFFNNCPGTQFTCHIGHIQGVRFGGVFTEPRGPPTRSGCSPHRALHPVAGAVSAWAPASADPPGLQPLLWRVPGAGRAGVAAGHLTGSSAPASALCACPGERTALGDTQPTSLGCSDTQMSVWLYGTSFSSGLMRRTAVHLRELLGFPMFADRSPGRPP